MRTTTKERMKALMDVHETYDEWISSRVAEVERLRDADLDAEAYRQIPEGTPDEWGDPTEHLVAMGDEAMDTKAEGWH